MTAAAVITLDTTAPTVTVTLPSRVEPPDVVTALVVASEPIGYSEYAFLDADGIRHALGSERIDAHSEFVMLPSTGLSGGTGSLLATVADEVGNRATRVWPIYVSRPRPYDVLVTSNEVYDTTTGVRAVFTLDLDTRSTYDTVVDLSRVYETEADSNEVFEIEVGSRAE